MQVGLGPGHIVLDEEPDLPSERGTTAPHFRNLRPYNPRPMSTVAKRSPISAAAELLLHLWCTSICLIEAVSSACVRPATHQALSVDTDEVAVASVAPGAVNQATEVVAEAVSDSGADQLTFVGTCACIQCQRPPRIQQQRSALLFLGTRRPQRRIYKCAWRPV